MCSKVVAITSATEETAMQIAERRLIVVEKGIKPAQWLKWVCNLKSSLPDQVQVTVLSETPLQLSALEQTQLAHLSIHCQSVDGQIPLLSVQDVQLFDEVAAWMQALRAQPSLKPMFEQTTYRGYVLWDLAEFAVIQRAVHHLIKRAMAIADLLAQPTTHVYVFEHQQSMVRALTVANELQQYTGSIEYFRPHHKTNHSQSAPAHKPSSRHAARAVGNRAPVRHQRHQLSRIFRLTRSILRLSYPFFRSLFGTHQFKRMQHISLKLFVTVNDYRHTIYHYRFMARFRWWHRVPSVLRKLHSLSVLVGELGTVPSTQPGPTHMFVVSNAHVYSKTMLRIIEHMQQQQHSVLLLGYKQLPSERLLRSHQIQAEQLVPDPWLRYVPFVSWLRIFVAAYRFDRCAADLQENPERQAAFRYRDVNVWNLVRPALIRIVCDTFVQMTLEIEALENIVSTQTPATWTAIDRHVQGRVAVEVARRHDMPSLTIQGAFMTDTSYLGRFHADTVAVIDEQSRELALRHNPGSSMRVVVTGLARWDRLRSKVKDQSATDTRIRSRLGITSTTRLVVIATQPEHRSHIFDMIRVTASALQHVPNSRLLIKLHPRDNRKHYTTWMATWLDTPQQPILVADIAAEQLLVMADLVIVYYSNLAFEAALADRPVLVMNFDRHPDKLPFVQQGIAYGAYDEDAACRAVIALLTNDEARHQLNQQRLGYFAQNPHLLDGKATHRVVALLTAMVQTRQDRLHEN